MLEKEASFAEVRVAFLKEEPLVDDCLKGLDGRRVLIVPDFLAEGFFTRQVIPRKLAAFPAWKKATYCPPVGTHPMMVELIDTAAAGLLDDWLPEETSLLVIGHGSGKNACSKQTLLSHLQDVRGIGRWGQVADLWLEEPPRVGEWREVAVHNQVIVVPYLLNDGQHGGWDIPDDLGVSKHEDVHGQTHCLGDYQLRLAPALGTSDRFGQVISELAQLWL